MHAGARRPLLRRGDRGAAHRLDPASSRPTSTRCGPWATSRTVATCWRSWAGPRPHRRPRRRRARLGGRVLLHHLPAAARPRARHHPHDAAASRAAQRRTCAPCSSQGGTDLVDAVFVLGALPDVAPVRYDAIEPLPGRRIPSSASGSPRRCRAGCTSGSWRCSICGWTRPPCPSPTRTLPRTPGPSSAAGPGSPTGGSPIRSRSSSRSTPFRRPPSGSARPAGSPRCRCPPTSARRPAPGWLGIRMTAGPGGRRHGRRDLRPVGQPGARGGAVDAARAAALPRRSRLIPQPDPSHPTVLRVAGRSTMRRRP